VQSTFINVYTQDYTAGRLCTHDIYKFAYTGLYSRMTVYTQYL